MANITPDIDDPEAQNRAYSPETLKSRENEQALPDSIPGYNRSADGLDDHPISGGDASGKEPAGDSAQAARAGEHSPSASSIVNNFTGKGKKSPAIFNPKNLKKQGPIAGIILTLVGGGIGVGALLSPSFLLIQLKEILSTSLATADPALSLRTRLMLRTKVSNISNSFTTEDESGSCGIKCRFGTMDNKLVKSFQKSGWTIETKDTRIPGRSVVTALGPPGVEPAKNAAEFNELFSGDDSTKNLSLLNKVINFRSAYYLNSTFKALTDRLGLTKSAKYNGDNTEAEAKAGEEVAEGLDAVTEGGDEETPAPNSDEAIDAKIGTERATGLTGSLNNDAIVSEIAGAKPPGETGTGSSGESTGGSKTGKALGAIGIVCMAYDVGKNISLAYKVAAAGAFIAVAFTIFNLADQIMAGDSPPPAAVSAAGDQLTKAVPYPSADSKTTATATDSAGYREVADGDNPGTLTAQQSQHSVNSPSGVIGFITTMISMVGASFIALTVLKAACNGAGQLAANAGLCAAEIGADSIVPVAGDAVGVGECLAENIAGPAAVAPVIGSVIQAGVRVAVFESLPDLAGLAGGDLGDVISVGATNLFNDSAASYGLVPATSAAQVAQYQVDTYDTQQQTAEVASYDARNTPFDINNQYSFLGSIAQNLNLVSFAGSSVTNNLTSIASIIPHSFGSLIGGFSTASAADAGASKLASLYTTDATTRPALYSIGAVSDAWGDPRMVMSTDDMNADPTQVVDAMVDGAGSMSSQVDPETGDPLPGTDYAKYMADCVNRTIPWGETSESISDAGNPGNDYDWSTGAACLGNTTGQASTGTSSGDIADASTSATDASTNSELSYFHVYTMDKAINDTLDDLYSDGDSSSDTTTSSSTDSTDTGSDDSSAYVPTANQSIAATIPEALSATLKALIPSRPNHSVLSQQLIASINPRVQLDNPQRYQIAWVG